jgi:hypothetical protein
MTVRDLLKRGEEEGEGFFIFSVRKSYLHFPFSKDSKYIIVICLLPCNVKLKICINFSSLQNRSKIIFEPQKGLWHVIVWTFWLVFIDTSMNMKE